MICLLTAACRQLLETCASWLQNMLPIEKDGSKLQALCNAAEDCASLPHDELDRSIRLVVVPVHSVFVAKDENKRALR
jgi:DNA-directed RNA polymerase III subunit RPC5